MTSRKYIAAHTNRSRVNYLKEELESRDRRTNLRKKLRMSEL
jgi:hypothetical protein